MSEQFQPILDQSDCSWYKQWIAAQFSVANVIRSLVTHMQKSFTCKKMYTLYLLIHFITPNLSCIQQCWRNLSIKKFEKKKKKKKESYNQSLLGLVKFILYLIFALIAMSSIAAVKLCPVEKMSPKYLYVLTTSKF